MNAAAARHTEEWLLLGVIVALVLAGLTLGLVAALRIVRATDAGDSVPSPPPQDGAPAPEPPRSPAEWPSGASVPGGEPTLPGLGPPLMPELTPASHPPPGPEPEPCPPVPSAQRRASGRETTLPVSLRVQCRACGQWSTLPWRVPRPSGELAGAHWVEFRVHPGILAEQATEPIPDALHAPDVPWPPIEMPGP